MSLFRFWSGKIKGWLTSRFIPELAYRGLLPRSSERNVVTQLWNEMAPWIHETWGRRPYDPKLPDLIRRHNISSILDVGCGSGWLFPMYQELGLKDVVGVDISERALELANQDYPNIKTICCRFEEMEFPHKRFDLAISESSLQHVPRHNIALVLQKLCSFCRLVYVKELTDHHPQKEEFFMHKFDYSLLFGQFEFSILETGIEEKFS